MQAFVDGKQVHVMPLVQDHKRAFDDDAGPNTGGMGSYSDRNHLLPFVSESHFEASSGIMQKVVDALREDTGEEYRGTLYGQFMISKSAGEEKPSPKLIEFNCRFGDPEAMNVLSILSPASDFLEICQGIAAGSLGNKQVSFQRKATVCKYLVPAGYPDKPSVGQAVSVDEEAVKKAELCGRCHQHQLMNIKIPLRRDLCNDCGDRHAGSKRECEGHTYENLLHDRPQSVGSADER